VIRAFEAKVAGRSSTEVSIGTGFVVAAGAKGLELDANGLLEDVVDANGFEDDVEEANGFPLPPGCPPKRDEPILRLVCSSSTCFLSCVSKTLDTRIDRIALMLPIFRLHALRRHAQMYSRLSWPKNCVTPSRVGRSPFSWSKRLM